MIGWSFDWRYFIPALFALLALVFALLAISTGSGESRTGADTAGRTRLRIALIFAAVSLLLVLLFLRH